MRHRLVLFPTNSYSLSARTQRVAVKNLAPSQIEQDRSKVITVIPIDKWIFRQHPEIDNLLPPLYQFPPPSPLGIFYQKESAINRNHPATVSAILFYSRQMAANEPFGYRHLSWNRETKMMMLGFRDWDTKQFWEREIGWLLLLLLKYLSEKIVLCWWFRDHAFLNVMLAVFYEWMRLHIKTLQIN